MTTFTQATVPEGAVCSLRLARYMLSPDSSLCMAVNSPTHHCEASSCQKMGYHARRWVIVPEDGSTHVHTHSILARRESRSQSHNFVSSWLFLGTNFIFLSSRTLSTRTPNSVRVMWFGSSKLTLLLCRSRLRYIADSETAEYP